VILSEEPLRAEDFDGHFGQVTRFIEAFSGWGESWSYDHRLLAGRPAGAICDANTKAWEVWTYLWWKTGMAPGLAFNLFVLLSFLCLPGAMFLSARLFRLDAWASIVVAFIASIIWFFDSQTHYFWWIGMTAWTFVSYLCLLTIGLFYRYSCAQSLRLAMATALSLALCLLIHPYSFIPLFFPMGFLYVGRFRRFKRAAHLQVAGIGLFAIVVNSWWLWVAFRLWHYVLDSGYYSQARLFTLVYDFFELVQDPNDTALFMRTGFRFLVIGAATVALIYFYRLKDDRFGVLAVAIGWLLSVTYFGSYFWIFSQIQPYRYIVPATFFSLIPAVALVFELSRKGFFLRLDRLSWALLGILSLPALQLLSRDILYYFPDLLPSYDRGQIQNENLILSAGSIRFIDLKHHKSSPADESIPRWFEAHLDEYRRVFVESKRLGEWLAYRIDNIEVLGGFLERNLKHSDANILRRYPGRSTPTERMKVYLETYAVKWVVLSANLSFPLKYRDLLKVRAKLPGGVICESKTKVSYFQQGSGRVNASMNRIEVRDTNPDQTLVLRYHWLETLSCSPDCRVAREPVPHDTVGFIRIAAPHPRDFTIYNTYQF